MITYEVSHNLVAVFLEKKRVGSIKYTISKGWQYTPKGQKEGGEFFETLAACKLSLEED